MTGPPGDGAGEARRPAGSREAPRAAAAWLPRLVARVPATVHAKLVVAFLATAALLIALVVVGLQVLGGVNRRAEDLLKRQERIAAYRQFQRDTALPSSWSWNERTLAATLQQLDRFRYQVDQLRGIAIDDADLLDRVRETYDELTRAVRQVVTAGAAPGTAGGRALPATDAGPLAERLEGLTNELVNRAEADLVARIDASHAAYRASRWVVIGFAAGSLALALILGYAISWSLIGPVKLMDSRLKLVGAGDFAQRVEVPNRDELGALAGAFNRMAASLRDSYAALEERTRELTEALEQQTATSEILRVLSSSPTDVQPVFDVIAREARRLCDASYGVVARYDGRLLHLAAHDHARPEGVEAMQRYFPARPGRATTSSRAILEGAVAHVPDVLEDRDYDKSVAGGLHNRSVLAVPMLHHGEPIGTISVGRLDPQPFSDKQIALLQTFADQAVIAIENVRLFTELEARNKELTESLNQQTATSDILRVIASTPTDLAPVFAAILQAAVRLFNAFGGAIRQFDGELVHLAAVMSPNPEADDRMRRMFPHPPDPDYAAERAIFGTVVHIPDTEDDPSELTRRLARDFGFRRLIGVPMIREGQVIGAINVTGFEPGLYSARQIDLLRTFADQAVIAIENVRLFTELQTRTQELTRSVEELRALGEVGRAVSGSLDLQSVLTSIVSHAVDLSQTDAGTIYEFDEAGQVFVPRASSGMAEELIEALRRSRIRVGDGGIGQAAATRTAVQIPDLEREPNYALPFLLEAGYRSLLAVPLLQEGRVIGGLVVRRKAAGAFPPAVVDLLQTFATQSVIAIQNARLFREIDEKSRALEELSRNQEQLSRLSTALQEPLSLAEQLTRVLGAARQVVGLDRLYIWTLSPSGDGLRVTAQAGFDEGDWQLLAGVDLPLSQAGALAAVCRDGEPLLFTGEHPLPAEYRLRPPYAALAGLRVKSFLVIPMIARGRTVGVLAADNRVSRAPIATHTMELLQTFAAQAAVAVENARLFQEIQEKSRELELASKHKSQFLANMSHELRTPMNAVLGYTDLILDNIFGDVPEPIRDTLERIKSNGQHLLGLINDVLDLSKMEAGQLTLSLGDYAMGEVVHAVVAAVESLAAAKKLGVKAIVPADLPPGRGDERRLTQVLLNLAGNAIKFTDAGQVTIEARLSDGAFLLSVSDTGPGISEADQPRIFEEFQQADSSSTRAKGGSGLGLSISRRIVELHGGRLWVESVLGQGSTFHFTVPIRVDPPVERA